MAISTMTPSDLALARRRLGLTLEQLGILLGYEGNQIRQMTYRLERGERTLRRPQQLLMHAYLSGYRPDNWPTVTKKA